MQRRPRSKSLIVHRNSSRGPAERERWASFASRRLSKEKIPSKLFYIMETRTLRAHFDGNQILLDEPFELEPNTELLVTILPKASEEDGEGWTRLSLEGLARAYNDNEPEYALDLIREANPEYEGR